MVRITSRATDELRTLRGVDEVSAHVGRAVTSDQAVGTGSGEVWIAIAPHADYDATLRSIHNVVDGYPGIRANVLTYESAATTDVLRPADNAAVVRVYGDSYGVLRRQAERIRQVLAGIHGLSDPRVELPAQQPTLRIESKLAAARRYGLKPGDIRRAAGTLVNGLEVGSFFEQQKVFSVVVRGVPATRSSLTSIRNLPIDTPTGGQVPLGDVASVRIAPDPVDIRHDAVSRFLDVRADVRGRAAGSVEVDVQRRLQGMSFPLDYHAELLRPPEDAQTSGGRLITLAIAAAFGILLLLQAAFGSWRLAALLFLALPAALAGGLLVVAADGGELSLGAVAGLLAVIGIAARGALVLIMELQRLENHPETGSALQRLERATDDTCRSEMVLRAARERFAPVVISAISIGLALLPLVIAGDVAGNELTHSAAAVVLGGLVSSTVLSLFIAPAIYLHYGPSEPVRMAMLDRRPAAPIAPELHASG
jgi:Cu/Ag efflux pump CusA